MYVKWKFHAIRMKHRPEAFISVIPGLQAGARPIIRVNVPRPTIQLPSSNGVALAPKPGTIVGTNPSSVTRVIVPISKPLTATPSKGLFKLFDWHPTWLQKCIVKERGGGQNISTSFWMRFSQAPLCLYRFKFIFDDIIFLLSGNIIEYICFWRFNSIIMTWNKWLVFTKSVIMGLNNISSWPCPLGFVCLPCVITWLYSIPCLVMRSVGVVVCLSLRMAKVPGSRRTQYSAVSVIFIAIIVLYFLLSFSRNG